MTGPMSYDLIMVIAKQFVLGWSNLYNAMTYFTRHMLHKSQHSVKQELQSETHQSPTVANVCVLGQGTLPQLPLSTQVIYGEL